MLRRALFTLMVAPAALIGQQAGSPGQIPEWYLNAPADTTRLCGRGTGLSSLEALASAVSEVAQQAEMKVKQTGRGQPTTFESSRVIGDVHVTYRGSRRPPVDSTLGRTETFVEIAGGDARITRNVVQVDSRADAELMHHTQLTGQMSEIVDRLKQAGMTFRTVEMADFRYYMLACIPLPRAR